MSFWFSEKSGSNTLVIDISSGSTAAALVRTKKGSVPEIITRTRNTYTNSNLENADSLEKNLLVSLNTSLSYIISQLPTLKNMGYESRIDKALVTLSSPWVESDVKIVEIKEEKDFEFNNKILRSVLEEERKNFSSKLENYFEEESEIFESAVMDLYLNGYPSGETMKEKVREVEVNFILSASTKQLLRKIKDEIEKVIDLKEGIVMHSFMYVFYKVLSHSFRNLNSALLINMTSDASDVMFIRHKGLAISTALPFGPDVITEALSAKLNVPDEIAQSYLSLFADGVLDQPTTESIDHIITERENSWKIIWEGVSKKIVDNSDVPYSIFLLAPYGFGKLVKIFLESIFPDRKIILLGDTNKFTKELVKGEEKNIGDENISILSSFSNLIN